MPRFNPEEMGDKELLNFLCALDKRARQVQHARPIKDGDTVKVAGNMPTSSHYALYKYHLPDDYWSALAVAKERDLI